MAKKGAEQFAKEIREQAGVQAPDDVRTALAKLQKGMKEYTVSDELYSTKKGWVAKMIPRDAKKSTVFPIFNSKTKWFDASNSASASFVKNHKGKVVKIGSLPKLKVATEVAKEVTKKAGMTSKMGGGLKKTAKAPGKLFMKLPPKGKAIVAGGGALLGILKLRKMGKKRKEARKEARNG